MKNIKSVIAVIMVLILSLVAFASCAENGGNKPAETTAADALNEITEGAALPDAQAPVATEASAVNPENPSETVLATEPLKLETVEEIVAYYNECANKVKTEAVKVVKNFEGREVEELVVPKILQSTADSLVPSFIKDDTEPVVYDTKDDIVNEFIVPGQPYVSRLTADDVERANCSDMGDTYHIVIKLKDEKNPSAGKGIGSACDVIEANEVAEKAPSFVKELTTSYEECTIVADIDKASGKMVEAVYRTPVELSVTVDLFGTHNVKVKIDFMKHYTITY